MPSDPIVEAKQAQSPPDESAIAKEKARKFLALAQQRFRLAEEAESWNRREALSDVEFRTGKQWPADVESARTMDGRPCLTMNRLPQFIRQVTNEQRQNRPGIRISPIGDGADVETAEILQGVIRHIEVNSEADVAYDTAFDAMVTGGIGFWRILPEYADDDSFEQDLKIRRIKNPFSIYFDPSCQEATYSDARWAFIVQDLSIDEYREMYPKSTLAALTEFSGIGNQVPGWAYGKTVRVAEYWYIEEEKSVRVRTQDGASWDKDEYAKINDPKKPPVVSSREVVKRYVKWAKINALEVLEEGEWPGKFIPIIPVLGDDIDVNGKRNISGLIRNAKDPMRMYNYWISSATETIALAPRAPIIVAEGQMEGHEQQWSQANVRNFAYLEYKPVTVAGQPAPPPQRQVYEPPIAAVSQMTRQADNDIKATMGIYDASLGQRGPEQSGRAILARQQQGDIATLNFSDNMARSIRFTGQQLVDLIPHYYSAPRIQRIIKPDQSVEQIALYNSETSGIASPEDALASLNNEAIKKVFDVGVGKYDVAISSGPSYQSKRQEGVASMMTLINSYPESMQLIGDLLIRQMDWPYAQEIADRLKKMLPPQLQEADPTDPQAAIQQMQQQMQEMMQQHELLTKALNEATETINNKKLEIESRERIANLQVQAQLVSTEAKIQGQAALATLQAQLDSINQRLAILNEDKPIAEPVGIGEPQ